MTAMQKALNAYGQATETIPPGKQIVLLYDGITRYLKVARLAIIERRINDRYMATQKASTIIEALQGCLDHEQGGEIAPQLDQLYTHFIFRLQAINIEDNVAVCDELIERISELRASWATIADMTPQSNEQPTQAPAEPAAKPSLSAALTI